MDSSERVCVQLEQDGQVYTCFVDADFASRLTNDQECRNKFMENYRKLENPSCLTVIEDDEPVNERKQPNTDIKWSHNETKELVALRVEQDKSFNTSKTHKILWDKIASQLLVPDSGHAYTGTQCANKWKSLKREYKSVIDHNAKTGNDPKKCKFYDELNNLYGNKPSTRPEFTLDSLGVNGSNSSSSRSSSNSATSSSSTTSSKKAVCSTPSTSCQKSSQMYQDLSPDSDTDDHDDETLKRKRSTPGRKTKSKQKKSPQTGIDRLLEFMAHTQKNEDERQKRHEEFIQKQNEEKLKRFDKLLDALMDK